MTGSATVVKFLKQQNSFTRNARTHLPSGTRRDYPEPLALWKVQASGLPIKIIAVIKQ
jgi:hypothetical protein